LKGWACFGSEELSGPFNFVREGFGMNWFFDVLTCLVFVDCLWVFVMTIYGLIDLVIGGSGKSALMLIKVPSYAVDGRGVDALVIINLALSLGSFVVWFVQYTVIGFMG
jgi:hypothetical protein